MSAQRMRLAHGISWSAKLPIFSIAAAQQSASSFFQPLKPMRHEEASNCAHACALKLSWLALTSAARSHAAIQRSGSNKLAEDASPINAFARAVARPECPARAATAL